MRAGGAQPTFLDHKRGLLDDRAKLILRLRLPGGQTHNPRTQVFCQFPAPSRHRTRTRWLHTDSACYVAYEEIGGAHEGRLRRKPSEVGVTKAPCGSRSGRLRVVVRDAAKSWNSGSSHTTGLGMTMPTLGKLPTYRSANQHPIKSAPVSCPVLVLSGSRCSYCSLQRCSVCCLYGSSPF